MLDTWSPRPSSLTEYHEYLRDTSHGKINVPAAGDASRRLRRKLCEKVADGDIVALPFPDRESKRFVRAATYVNLRRKCSRGNGGAESPPLEA